VVIVAVPDGSQAQAVAGPTPGPLDRVPAVALVLIAITSLQIGAALGATLFDEVGPAGSAAVRLVFAALILVAVVRPRLRGRSASDLRLVGLFGLTLGAMNLAIYEAIDRVGLGIAVTVEFVGPLAVAIFLSRRRLDLVWVVLAGAGILLLADPGGSTAIDGLGLAFALAAAAGWAAYILLAARTGPRFHGAEGPALAMIVAVLIPLGPGIAQGGADLLRPEVLAIGAAVGLLSSAIPYTLETEALRRIPRNVFGVLMSIEPAVAALAGLAILGESLGARQALAIALVVVASIGALREVAPPAEA
jgi:inner membrane transporter RhtA